MKGMNEIAFLTPSRHGAAVKGNWASIPIQDAMHTPDMETGRLLYYHRSAGACRPVAEKTQPGHGVACLADASLATTAYTQQGQHVAREERALSMGQRDPAGQTLASYSTCSKVVIDCRVLEFTKAQDTIDMITTRQMPIDSKIPPT